MARCWPLVPKFYLAYRAWVWAEFIVQILAMMILVFFWRAVYANGGTLGGLTFQQTLNYILIAQMLMPLIENRLIFNFGWMIREGQVAIDLLRPMDFQARFYVDAAGQPGLEPAAENAAVDHRRGLLSACSCRAMLATWLVFLVSLMLGHAVMFFFDWIFSLPGVLQHRDVGPERGARGRGDVLQRRAGAAADDAGLAARHRQCAAVRAVGVRAGVVSQRHHADQRCAASVADAAGLADRAGA